MLPYHGHLYFGRRDVDCHQPFRSQDGWRQFLRLAVPNGIKLWRTSAVGGKKHPRCSSTCMHLGKLLVQPPARRDDSLTRAALLLSNGIVDAPDDNIWRDNFVNGTGSSVPEPSSMRLPLPAA